MNVGKKYFSEEKEEYQDYYDDQYDVFETSEVNFEELNDFIPSNSSVDYYG